MSRTLSDVAWYPVAPTVGAYLFGCFVSVVQWRQEIRRMLLLYPSNVSNEGDYKFIA